MPDADPGGCLLKAETLLFGELPSDCAPCMLAASSSHVTALTPASTSRNAGISMTKKQESADSTLAAQPSRWAAATAVLCHQSLQWGRQGDAGAHRRRGAGCGRLLLRRQVVGAVAAATDHAQHSVPQAHRHDVQAPLQSARAEHEASRGGTAMR